MAHVDALRQIDDPLTLGERLDFLHQDVKRRFDFVDRISVAIHDPATDYLKTLIHSSGGMRPLEHYDARLREVPSLMAIRESRQPRVIHDLGLLAGSASQHSRRLLEAGYGSSYTLPIFQVGRFMGFVFFNSMRRQVFAEDVLRELDVYGHLVGLMVVGELDEAHALASAVRTAIGLMHERDDETGYHIDRMANYARLVAKRLAPTHGLDDEAVESIYSFAPLHDIGKIAIPDDILRKPARLSAAEYEVMKTHAEHGRKIVEAMLANLGMECHRKAQMLRNITFCHHETMNGQGYPAGLAGQAIPLEARIVSVADVFDALTNPRPYKNAWDNDQAFAYLREQSGHRFDPDCVDALVESRVRIEEIQDLFRN